MKLNEKESGERAHRKLLKISAKIQHQFHRMAKRKKEVKTASRSKAKWGLGGKTEL